MTEQPAPAPFNLLSALFQDRPMAAIWSESAHIEGWLRTEAALAHAQADENVIDRGDADAISAVCSLDIIDAPRLWDEARNVGYPILPLVRRIAAALPDGPNGRVHYGATTQDIMDTALALQLGAACGRVEELLLRFGDALQLLTIKHASTVMPARTHAQHAVPTSFGAKVAVFLDEVRRQLEQIRLVGVEVRVVSLFGAGGTSAAMGERSANVRAALARRLNLADTDVPWHVARGRITRYGLTLATIAALCSRFAREVVDLSRTEIAEVHEVTGHHRGASSTMPQKANPISSESTIGLAVSAGAAATALLRSMEAGHERACGEWQVEWVVLPWVSVLTATALDLSADTAESLQVFPEAMQRNLNLEAGLIMSEALMMRLAPIVGRERAHDLLYEAAGRGRLSGESLQVALRAVLPVDLIAEIGPIEPSDYLGEAERICASAGRAWAETRNQHDDDRLGTT